MRRPCWRSIGLLVFVLGSGSAAAQNLLVNPGFTANLSGWSLEENASAAWSPLDIAGSTASGSALVTNLSPFAGQSTGIVQCVALVPGETLRPHVRFRVPSGQAGTTTVAEDVGYYAGASCGGAALSGFGNGAGTITSAFDVWRDLDIGIARRARGRRERHRQPPRRKGRGGGKRPGVLRRAVGRPVRDADDSGFGVDPRAERDLLSHGSLGLRRVAALHGRRVGAAPVLRVPELRLRDPDVRRRAPRFRLVHGRPHDAVQRSRERGRDRAELRHVDASSRSCRGHIRRRFPRRRRARPFRRSPRTRPGRAPSSSGSPRAAATCPAAFARTWASTTRAPRPCP